MSFLGVSTAQLGFSGMFNGAFKGDIQCGYNQRYGFFIERCELELRVVEKGSVNTHDLRFLWGLVC